MTAYNLTRDQLRGFIKGAAQARRDTQSHNPGLANAARGALHMYRMRIATELRHGARFNRGA